MSGKMTITPKQRRRWFQFRLRTLFVAFTVVALVLGLVIHYRAHLVWCVAASRLGLADVQRVPVTAMPDAAVPEDWVACRFGSLQFDLPPGFVRSVQGSPKGGMIVLRDDPRAMMIYLPGDQTDSGELLQSDLEMPPEGRGLSMVMLRLACFQTASNEFRWSMSPEEVRWFVWRISIGRFMRMGSEQRAETLMCDDLEGAAYYRSGCAELDWRSKESQASGNIHFIDKSEEEIDPAWVRAVCRSLRFTGESLSRPRSREEVEALFQVITE
jgi:hypothetical protein